MERAKLLFRALTAALIASAGNAAAQTPEAAESIFDLNPEELYEVEVVTASRSKRSIKELPVTVFVMTEEEIERNGYTSLTQALRDLPGIKTSIPGNGTEGELFWIRGLFGNYYVKYLLDGVPINPLVMSGFPIAEQINMRNVQRIEVVYGPASSLYGADAVGGVINIVTKTPNKDGVEVEVKGGGKEYYYGNVYGSYGVKVGDHEARLNLYGLVSDRGDWDIEDGYEALLDRNRYPLAEFVRDPFAMGDIESKSMSAGAQLSWGGFRLSYDIMDREDNSSLGQLTSFYFYDDPDAIWGETIQRVLLSHEGSSGDFTFRTNLSYLWNRLNNESYFSFIFPTVDPSTFGQRNRAYKYQASDEIFFEEIITWNISKDVELVSGFQYSYAGDMAKTNDLSGPFDEDLYEPFSEDRPPASPIFGNFGFNPETYDQVGIFTQGTYSQKNWLVLAGLRYDHDSRYGGVVSPRVGGRYDLTSSTSLVANYGHAFKGPSNYYQYNSVAGLNPDGTINYLGIPAPDRLDPEELDAFEVGVRHLWSSAVSTDVNLFYNTVDKIISPARFPVDPARYPNGGNTTAGGFDNGATLEFWGGDLIVRGRDLVHAVRLGVDLYLTYIDGEQDFPPGLGSIDAILSTPEWTGKARVFASPLEALQVGVDTTWHSDWYSRGLTGEDDFRSEPDRKINGDVVFDFYSKYDATDNVALFFEVQNLTDRHYSGIEAYQGSPLPGNPQSGRAFYGGVNFKW